MVKLTYFDLEGRGELIRLLLHAGNIDFEDFRFGFGEWAKHKPNTPFGSVPVLHWDGEEMAQTMAIVRKAARIEVRQDTGGQGDEGQGDDGGLLAQVVGSPGDPPEETRWRVVLRERPHLRRPCHDGGSGLHAGSRGDGIQGHGQPEGEARLAGQVPPGEGQLPAHLSTSQCQVVEGQETCLPWILTFVTSLPRYFLHTKNKTDKYL